DKCGNRGIGRVPRHRHTSAADAEMFWMARGRGACSSETDLRRTAEQADVLDDSFGVSACRIDSGDRIAGRVLNLPDRPQAVGDYKTVADSLNKEAVTDICIYAGGEI